MLTHAAYHFYSSLQRVIDQWQVSHALCNFGRKKRGVCDDIKYTWTNLKFVRLGIARAHGWVELAPTVQTSSSHRSSTWCINTDKILSWDCFFTHLYQSYGPWFTPNFACEQIDRISPNFIYSQISVIRTSINRNYWVIWRRRTVPTFLSIIYCNKTTDYSNFYYPKNSIFRSDSLVLIEEIAIKLPFKIRSLNVTHGDHDFFVPSSLIYTPEWFSKQSDTRLMFTLLRNELLSEKMVSLIKVVCNDCFVWCFLNV